MIERIFTLLTGLGGSTIYGGLFGILLLCGFGLPLPEDIVLLTGGYLAHTREWVDPYTVTLVCLAGVLLGDSIIFGVGKRYGEDILDAKLVRKAFSRKRMERASYYFEKYGRKVVFVGRFIAGARAPIFLIAGILKMPYRTFILLDGSAALISVPFFVWVGHTFADDVQHAFEVARRSQHALIVLLVAFLAIIAYRIYAGLERKVSEEAVRRYEEAHPDAAAKAHVLPEVVPGIAGHAKTKDGDGMKMNIFKAYDIRGRVPDELDEEGARRIGWAVGKFLEVPQIVVGRDARTSADAITDALCRGLNQAGVKVLDVGRSTTPLTNFAIGERNVGGGIMVTASHNPPEYNGFKISKARAVPVYDQQIKQIGELAHQAPESVQTSPQREPIDVREQFIEKVVSRARADGRRLKVVADLSNGAAAHVSPDIFKRLPHEVVVLNGDADGNFPNHPPDPLVEGNLEQCRAAIVREKADLGAVYDGDADRIVFLDEHGRTVTGDLATLLMALNLLESTETEKPVVFYDVRSSRIVPETLRKAGADPRRCRVGHAFIKTAMREADGLCAGELSGHYYFRDNYFAENSDLALVLLLNMLSESDQSLSDIVAPYRVYFPSGEMSFEVADKEGAIERAAKTFADGRQSRLDGLTVEYDNWWFNLRPSNTEPLLRLNLESTTSAEDMLRRRDEVLGLLKAHG